ncbi:helicase-related protein [Pontibacter lucknowensis]|uniref:SNF2 family N-terminal domain-containing protein n=1 Tax=Pontibacter lucknowensis TaxID=1077936 RepID=A0A1N6TIN1_9BACT|nr:helicase-related protein [Pontibacter lucknowensis]SIQ53131.1 SNF2 family N-terminal domain-containing protein [Pontibacter lucknowensis]
MLYKGKAVEVLGTKEVFGEQVAWIRILENNDFKQVALEELEHSSSNFSLAHLRFIAIAAKIKDEVAKKNILAPYESSLIPLPHQILVLEKVMQSTQNRFLLADEVGMGKTIEAGLILKELKLRGDIKRILVIVPKSAMLQWQSELKEHFNEVFHIYDSELITSLARTFSNINADQEFNFWEQHNQIIVSTDALKPLERRQGWPQERIDEYNKYRMEAVLNANFDLVVIDEVHKMGGANQLVSRYLLAQALCNTVPNALLLSATPHRGKSDHFRRILQLLDSDAFASEELPEIAELEPYVIRTEKRLAVDYEGNKLFNERETERFDVYLDDERHRRQKALYNAVTDYVIKGFNTARRTNNQATGLIMILFQRLVSSSTAAILSAMQGRLERLRNAEDDELEDYQSESDATADEPLDTFDLEGVYANSAGALVDEDSLLQQLIAQAQECLRVETDAKAEAFISKYKVLQQEYSNPDLKTIIFTEFRTTQKMLKELLEERGYRCAIINGSQELDERKAALGKFRNQAQILIATDAAGESLNMQFCHIIFNYDLPWNPMMIEQRIGRVDRIGQKHKVKAYNMLTDNSVDQRVYEVIEEKLTNIIEQLGIDKTSDVLDSAIDLKKVNKLYLQSLLDPTKFEFAGDKWLNEIKGKLRDYQSTEGILPKVQESEIEYKKAADVKHSPLPVWLEDLLVQYCAIHNGKVERNLAGIYDIQLNGLKQRVTFEQELALSEPGVEHLTLQHDTIRRILSDINEYNYTHGIPVLRSRNNDETPGIWSIWQISAQNSAERKVIYHSYFVADNGKMYAAYANDIWNRILSGNHQLDLVDVCSAEGIESLITQEKEVLRSYHFNAFQNLEADMSAMMEARRTKRVKSFEFQASRINKIGIENIRFSKLKRLQAEHDKWLAEFKASKKVIPGVKHLLSVRIDG